VQRKVDDFSKSRTPLPHVGQDVTFRARTTNLEQGQEQVDDFSKSRTLLALEGQDVTSRA
jgi:hypothetical protein